MFYGFMLSEKGVWVKGGGGGGVDGRC